MSNSTNRLIKVGCGTALVVATLLSPLASSDPDGLDRVATDLKFAHKADSKPLAQQLPFYQVFEEYQLKVVSTQKISTALAGIIGTSASFGLTWAIAKLMLKSAPQEDT
ncbi:MAG: PDGLE domain-containing protein [Pseudanabaenaceae cyanobacterium bins.68]|nr:PDGLE domain-containing protein [Pseudanabaenaceae cyanobacterium bins.68]